MGLLDTATVRRGNGPWSNGYDLEESGCGLAVRVAEVCAPTFQVLVGDPMGAPNILHVSPFSIDAVLSRSVRCALDTDMRRVGSTLGDGEEYVIAHVFENGVVDNWASPNLHHEDVERLTLAKGLPALETLDALLHRYYAKTTSKPTVHIGMTVLLDLMKSLDKNMLEPLGIDLVYSPGYSHSLVAATGPVTVHIGTSETIQVYDAPNNKTDIQATAVAAVEFDVCEAVLVSTS